MTLTLLDLYNSAATQEWAMYDNDATNGAEMEPSLILALNKSILEILSNYDLIIGPTTTDFAYSFGCQTTDAIKSFSDDLLTIPVNMAGLPSMSMNIGDKKPIADEVKE